MTSRYNKIFTIIAIMLAAMLAPAGAAAQSDALFSQYWALPSYYNPAAAGNSDSIKITAGAKMQWVGIPNAPVTFTGLADSPFKVFGKRIGVGIAFSQESIGLFSTINVGAQLAYKMPLLGGTLSIGLQVGLANQTFRGTEVFIPEGDDYHNSDDEAIPTNDIAGMAFDMAAGVFYTHRWFWASLSSTHVLQPTMTLKSENSQAQLAGLLHLQASLHNAEIGGGKSHAADIAGVVDDAAHRPVVVHRRHHCKGAFQKVPFGWHRLQVERRSVGNGGRRIQELLPRVLLRLPRLGNIARKQRQPRGVLAIQRET